MRVAVLAPSHPRGGDSAVELWARRQALAARDAGAEIHLLAPRRPHALSLRTLRHRLGFDLLHAHGAHAALAAQRARLGVPTVVSVSGRDLFRPPSSLDEDARTLADALRAARLTLVGSEGAAALARGHGASETRVLRPGIELPARRGGQALRDDVSPREADGDQPARHRAAQRSGGPTLVTVGRLIARKRHADVLRALAVLAPRHQDLRYAIVGDGVERIALEGLSQRLGIAGRVEIAGQLPPEDAIARARACTIFVMPSTEEACGVAYVEAMAAGVPAIGCRGEPGPEEIAAAGDGFVLVPPADVERLSQRIDELIGDQQRLREAAMHARETVAAHFTWERWGRQTLAAYEDALR